MKLKVTEKQIFSIVVYYILQVELSQAVLRSLQQYYEIMRKDMTRSGVISRQLCLDAITGLDVRDNSLLSSLAERIGARKESILNSAKRRAKLDQGSKLLPIVARMQRKSPEGSGYLTDEWVLKVVLFYEWDSISDVMKGHCNTHKVKY